MRWSIISSAAGTSPAAMIPLTVSAADATDVKSSSRVATTGASGVSRTAMRVAMPSVPSLPTNAPRRSRPAGSASSPPSTVTAPSGRTTSSATTWALVTP
jgi:hypothetical protein